MAEEEETEGLMQYINRVNKEAEDKATKISNFTIEDFEEMIKILNKQRIKPQKTQYPLGILLALDDECFIATYESKEENVIYYGGTSTLEAVEERYKKLKNGK